MGKKNSDSQSDQDFLRQWAENFDHDAFRVLVGRHLGMVQATLRRLNVSSSVEDDLAQTVFIGYGRSWMFIYH